MRQQDLTDSAILRKVAENARRLEGDLRRQQPAAPGSDPAPKSLDEALDALRSIAELLVKESVRQ